MLYILRFFKCNSHELYLYLCFILVVFYNLYCISIFCIIVTNLALWLQDVNKLIYLHGTIILVSGEVKFIRIFAGGHPSEDIELQQPPRQRKFDK